MTRDTKGAHSAPGHRLVPWILSAIVVAALPPASAEPLVNIDRCISGGASWIDCQGHTSLEAGPYGKPRVLKYGVTTSPECGSASPADVLHPHAPTVGQCWVWVGVGAGEATFPTPNLEAVLAGNA